MVEVVESSWKTFQDQIQQVTNLDELMDIQAKHSKSILDKALLSEEQRELNRLLKRLLNNVYTFALIKERYFFKSALDEYERLQRVAQHEKAEQEGYQTTELNQADLVSQINE